MQKPAVFITIASLLMSSTVFAESISCQIGFTNADKAGYLMPSFQKLSMEAPVTKDGAVDENQCATAKFRSLNLMLCAREADFVGGYDVALTNTGKKSQNLQVVSARKFGTLKSGEGLVEVYRTDKVLNSFLKKTTKAGIASPLDYNGDSLALDEAVQQGIAKGVLIHEEPVLSMLSDCQLIK